jgi:fused signal recognition particle receptor
MLALATNALIVMGALWVVLIAVVILLRARKSRNSLGDAASMPAPTPSDVASSNSSEAGPASAASIESVAANEVAVSDSGSVDETLKPQAEVEATEAGSEDTAGIEAPAPDVRERTAKSRGVFASAFAKMRGRSGITQDTWDDLEETLLKADIGIGLTTRLLEPLRASVKSGDIRNADELIAALRNGMTAQLTTTDRSLHLDAAELPNVWLFVGVNGVGKTTTIGKIATAEAAKGTSVLMAAGDTFRAAAAEQLQVWSERSGAAFVRGAEGGDPASVIFDGIQSAASKNITLVLGDTAGRLQNKSNLMEELKKVRRVADRAPGTVNEVLLVIDATTGQNGLSQAREFAAATDVTGVVLTKLDGSAKGGIVFAIETDLGIPVKLVGLGEGAHDLVPFTPSDYVSALFE